MSQDTRKVSCLFAFHSISLLQRIAVCFSHSRSPVYAASIRNLGKAWKPDGTRAQEYVCPGIYIQAPLELLPLNHYLYVSHSLKIVQWKNILRYFWFLEP